MRVACTRLPGSASPAARHEWSLARCRWDGTGSVFEWRCARCLSGAEVRAPSSVGSSAAAAYLPGASALRAAGVLEDCSLEAARAVHES